MSSNGLTPYNTIMRAISGDTASIAVVLKKYESYMDRLSMRIAYTPNGKKIMVKDEDIKRELQIELITKISHFDPMNG